MNISAKWKQIHKQAECADSKTRRDFLTKPVWRTFDISDISGKSRNHAISLFSRSIHVIIKQGDIIISNDREMRNLYRKKGNTVYALTDIQSSDQTLEIAGFTPETLGE